MDLIYHEHKVKLKNYEEYDRICAGLVDLDLDNMKEESLEDKIKDDTLI